MASPPGTPGHPLRVAVVGSGPAGFYAAGHLLSAKDLSVEVDMFDRLPTPFGLVRAGVAPDHPKIKSVTRVYEKTAAKPGFRFFGGVELGRDVTREELLERVWGYDYFGDTRLLDVHIRRLRKKVEDDPAAPTLIHTVRGIGYKIKRP